MQRCVFRVDGRCRRALWGRLRAVPLRETDRAEAIRALASLLRIGMSPHAALLEWHREVPASVAPALGAVARRLRLAADVPASLPPAAVLLGDDHAAFVGILAAGRDAGGDVASMLDGLARVIEDRVAATGAARAAGGGAQLSARLVAALPLAFLPLMPAARAPLTDPTGVVMVLTGLAFCGGGIAWIERLFPRPPSDDAAAAVASLAAAVLRGGCGLHVALEVASRWAPAGTNADIERARRMVVLGRSWRDALGCLTDDGLRGLGATLSAAHTFGLPVAGALDDFAARRRAASAREFDRAMRRAPVLMVVPLTVCVLPSFVLLGLGPFLRGVSLS